MQAFRNVVFWFILLLVVLVAGFWKTYFSVFFQDMHPTHHFHGLTMLLWVLLLITQAWLVRTRRLDIHRSTGKLSFVLAPLIVVSGVVVTYYNIGHVPDPMAPFVLSIFWLGLYSAALFGILYALAMYYRKDFNLHARYMITTGLVFVVPGLSRISFNILDPMGLPSLSFYQTQILVAVFGLVLILWDRKLGRIRAPFVVFSLLWATNLLVWQLIPGWGWWQTFTAWSAAVMS